MADLKVGLTKLNRSDPSVNFFQNKRGEYILSTCGEIHLQRCVKDLNDDFCPGIKFNVSDPIIPFKEAIINKRLTNRVINRKNENFEDRDESESEEEQKTKEERTVQEMIEYEDKMAKYNEQLALEKELLKKA
jgi:ribosome assembly protein 1